MSTAAIAATTATTIICTDRNNSNNNAINSCNTYKNNENDNNNNIIIYQKNNNCSSSSNSNYIIEQIDESISSSVSSFLSSTEEQEHNYYLVSDVDSLSNTGENTDDIIRKLHHQGFQIYALFSCGTIHLKVSGTHVHGGEALSGMPQGYLELRPTIHLLKDIFYCHSPVTWQQFAHNGRLAK